MEFHAQVARFLKHDQEYYDLQKLLEKQTQDCFKKSNDDSCFSREKHFQEYLENYKRQYAEKGYEICKKTTDLDQCMNFYKDNILNFKDNCLGKLNSLIYNYDHL